MIITIIDIERALQGLSASSTINEVKRTLLSLGVTPLRNRKGIELEELFELDIDEQTYEGCTSYTRVTVEVFRGEHSCEAPTPYYYKIK